MISHVAVLPLPPLLVPELVVADVPEVAAVRRSCLAAAHRLARASRRWIAVGPGHGRVEPDAVGTFKGYGVDVRVALSDGAAAPVDPTMPLSGLIAGWLRMQVGVRQVSLHLIDPGASAERCRAVGARIAAEADEPVGLLVLGDGSHRHGDRAPGRPDPRAAGFDDGVRAALAAVDRDALLALDESEAGELGADGRVAWQALAGATETNGQAWRCTTSELMVPFGVAYHVAVWEPS